MQPLDEKTTYEQKIMGRMTLHKESGLKTKSGLETQGNRVTQLLLFFFSTLNKFVLCGFAILFFILHQDCLVLLGKHELLGRAWVFLNKKNNKNVTEVNWSFLSVVLNHG